MSDNAIEREIESWQGFSAILRRDDREKFAIMMSEAKAYNAAFQSSPAKEPGEVLLMTLILRQQEIIATLKDELAKLEKRKK